MLVVFRNWHMSLLMLLFVLLFFESLHEKYVLHLQSEKVTQNLSKKR